MRRPEFIARQARHPSGALGHVIGTIMSFETRALNRAVIDALQLGTTDRVLEVGFGHGRALPWAAEATPAGHVAGIDVSATMMSMASRHCRKLIAEGKVELRVGDSRELPYPDASFDAIYAVHAIYFWNDMEAQLRELRRVLKTGSRLVLGFRAGADRNFPESVYTFRSVDQVSAALRTTGFEAVRSAEPAAQSPVVILSASAT